MASQTTIYTCPCQKPFPRWDSFRVHWHKCRERCISSPGLFQCPCKYLYNDFGSLEAHYYERHCGTPGRPKNKQRLTEVEQGTSSIQQNIGNTSDSAVTMTRNDDNNYPMQNPNWSMYSVYNHVTAQSLLSSQVLDTQIYLPEHPMGVYPETYPNHTTFNWGDQYSNVDLGEACLPPSHADVPAASMADADATPPQQAATDDQAYWPPFWQ